jgi:hypothetical protein
MRAATTSKCTKVLLLLVHRGFADQYAHVGFASWLARFAGQCIVRESLHTRLVQCLQVETSLSV